MLLQKLRAFNITDRIQGVIMDSAPFYRVNEPADQSMVNSVLRLAEYALRLARPAMPGILRRVEYDHPLGNVFAAGVVAATVANVVEDIAPADAFLDQLLSEAMVGGEVVANGVKKLPHLLLYSQGDKLVLAEAVEGYGEQVVAAQGGNRHITLKDFVDSPHCMHFRRHQEEYTSIVLEWLGSATSSRACCPEHAAVPRSTSKCASTSCRLPLVPVCIKSH